VLQTSNDGDVERIALEVERYVLCHPAAADTLDGIARWWLVRAVHPPLVLVEAALERLVRRGVLTRHQLPDGNCVYSRAARPAEMRKSPKPIGEP
jgi:hypothetical protein